MSQAELKLEQRAVVAESREVERKQKRFLRREALRALDEQLADALKRIEAKLGGPCVYKWLADELTDDEEKPVSENMIYDWLARRNGRRPPADLIHIVCEHDTEFMHWWSESSGFERPDRISALSPAEQVEVLRRKLLEFGKVGEEKVAAAEALFARGETGDRLRRLVIK